MKIFENISLRTLNSFGVEARAARLVEWASAAELRELVREGAMREPVRALGGGNNILFTRDFDGTLLRSVAKTITITAETDEKIEVKAEAGVDWGEFVEWCTARELWGAENLAAIPGTVGAAPIQNIGAYGAEVADIVSSVECLDLHTGTEVVIAAAHAGFGYRDSVFKGTLKGRVIVTAVNFTLSREPRPRLDYAALAELVARMRAPEAGSERSNGSNVPSTADISRAVAQIRASKLPDPRQIGSAGSFFKNPVVDTAVAARLAADHPGMPLWPAAKATSTAPESKTKLSAGWLIEQAGWKGRSEGHVGIYPRQALIVVNLGGATGSEIAQFAHRVSTDVESKFGVALTPEVNVW